jgi:uncharacterized protein involved in propanediol utilization
MAENSAFSAAAPGSIADTDHVFLNCSATLNGKRGELVQGQTSGGVDFLCAMPFPIAGSVKISVRSGRHISTNPTGMHKTARFVRSLLDASSLHEVGGHLEFTLQEQIGVGCGTSSQMMQLVYNALAANGHVVLSLSEYGQLISSLEPNDFFCSNGLTRLWDYKRGVHLSETFDLPLGCYVAAYPIGQTLYTDDVDRQRPRYTQQQLDNFDNIFAELIPAARRGDLRAIGEMTCLSADINDIWFSKPSLPNLRSLVKARAAEGYFVGHSGTVVGAFHGDPDALESLLGAFSTAVGRGYDVAVYKQTRETRRHPFLLGCGSTLRRFVS